MEILYRGAESVIYIGECDGKKAIVKERIRKVYRISQIDGNLRKYRTRKEVKLLADARKAGVPTPQVLNVDEERQAIFMEFIDGNRVKELLNSSGSREAGKVCRKIGRMVGKLHSAGIIHGDLTTSNMLMRDGKIYLIDFGLGESSRRVEDQGVDLNLLYEALKSTHVKILNICWRNILTGYQKEYKGAEQVLRKVDEIERRARYAER